MRIHFRVGACAALRVMMQDQSAVGLTCSGRSVAAHVFESASVSVAINWRYALIAFETMFQVALQQCREMHH
jgi:hypothetical protein